eukprot:scaffold79986_cov20-Tisochrysis_lutea.AAC.1
MPPVLPVLTSAAAVAVAGELAWARGPPAHATFWLIEPGRRSPEPGGQSVCAGQGACQPDCVPAGAGHGPHCGCAAAQWRPSSSYTAAGLTQHLLCAIGGAHVPAAPLLLSLSARACGTRDDSCPIQSLGRGSTWQEGLTLSASGTPLVSGKASAGAVGGGAGGGATGAGGNGGGARGKSGERLLVLSGLMEPPEVARVFEERLAEALLGEGEQAGGRAVGVLVWLLYGEGRAGAFRFGPCTFDDAGSAACALFYVQVIPHQAPSHILLL